jgi:hypothetical protein
MNDVREDEQQHEPQRDANVSVNAILLEVAVPPLINLHSMIDS